MGLKSPTACFLFMFSLSRSGGHFPSEQGVTFVRAQRGHFPSEFPLSGKSVFAQDIPNRFLLSVYEYYSPKTNSNTTEIGVGYLFSKAGVRVNYGRIGLAEEITGHEETISLFIPVFNINSFSLIPEVAAGIMHGNIESNETVTVKSQVQVGVSLTYTISRHMSCGLSYKSLFYDRGIIPLLGWAYSVHF